MRGSGGGRCCGSKQHEGAVGLGGGEGCVSGGTHAGVGCQGSQDPPPLRGAVPHLPPKPVSVRDVKKREGGMGRRRLLVNCLVRTLLARKLRV